MRIAAALLESYERQVQSVEGALKVTVTPEHPPPSPPLPSLPFPNPSTLVPVASQRSYSAV